MSRDIIEDWPPVKIRPPDSVVRTNDQIERYDEMTGTFIPDDGQPGYAFSAGSMAYYYKVPYYDNVIGKKRRARGDNPRIHWHYQTRDGKPTFGESYANREMHPSEVAGRKAMERTCERYGVANGRGTEPEEPENFTCAWCANDSLGHRRDLAVGEVSRAESELEEVEKQVKEAQGLIDRFEVDLPRIRERLERLKRKEEALR